MPALHTQTFNGASETKAARPLTYEAIAFLASIMKELRSQCDNM